MDFKISGNGVAVKYIGCFPIEHTTGTGTVRISLDIDDPKLYTDERTKLDFGKGGTKSFLKTNNRI
jgi:hypothetical protein